MSNETLSSNAATPGAAFLQASAAVLRNGLHKINHCCRQLTDEQVWQRPRPEMNSIANVLIHLTGNLRQWILSGAGGVPDTRHRQAEFDDRSMRPKAELLKDLTAVIDECQSVLLALPEASLVEKRKIQGFDIQLLAGIYDTTAHLKGHVQEIICMTRLVVGPAYQFDFVPKKEQGGI